LTIDHRLRSIEAKRARLIDLLSGIEPARLAAHPRPGKWSIQEILEHLVLAEVDVFGDPARLGQQTPRPRRTKDRILYLVVMFILRFNISVSVPSPAMSPKGGLSLTDVRVQWEANHDRLRAWIASSDRSLLDRPLFRHPVAGPMTTAQSLRMLEVHLDRHVRQIDALVSSAASSGGQNTQKADHDEGRAGGT
jgi:hypothetical protein